MKRRHSRTFFDEVIPLLCPGTQALRVCLLDVGAFLHQGDEVRTQSVAVLDASGGPLVVARLPEGVTRRHQHVVVAVVGHGVRSRACSLFNKATNKRDLANGRIVTNYNEPL